MNAQHQPTGSAYFIEEKKEELVSHTLSILVDNEPGVLSRIMQVGWFLEAFPGQGAKQEHSQGFQP